MTDDHSLAPTKQSTIYPQEQDSASRVDDQRPLWQGSPPPSEAASTQVGQKSVDHKSVDHNSTMTAGTSHSKVHHNHNGPYAVTPHSEMVMSLGGPGTVNCREWSKTADAKKLFHDSYGFWQDDEAE